MAYQIQDNTGTIKITNNGLVKHIVKPAIVEVSVIRGSVIKISTGNILENIYINHADVSAPISFSADHLRLIITSMVDVLGYY